MPWLVPAGMFNSGKWSLVLLAGRYQPRPIALFYRILTLVENNSSKKQSGQAICGNVIPGRPGLHPN